MCAVRITMYLLALVEVYPGREGTSDLAVLHAPRQSAHREDEADVLAPAVEGRAARHRQPPAPRLAASAGAPACTGVRLVTATLDRACARMCIEWVRGDPPAQLFGTVWNCLKVFGAPLDGGAGDLELLLLAELLAHTDAVGPAGRGPAAHGGVLGLGLDLDLHAIHPKAA